MKDMDNKIIYIGKAVNLKNRVSQYFNKNNTNKSIKVIKLVQNIVSFEYIVTNTEVEALVLECNLIKKYNPKYNIRLKDDKHYPYIKIDLSQDYPVVQVVRKVKKDNAQYFGPYTDGHAMWELVEIIKKTWKLRTCTKNLSRIPQRECLNFHIQQCSAPCINNISEVEYKEILDEVIIFLKGNYKQIIKSIEAQMKIEADNMNFEKAAQLRDQMRSILKIEQKQIADNKSTDNQDIIAFAKDDKDTLVQIYFVRNGKLLGREHFMFRDDTDIPLILRNFIVQFYDKTTFIPKEVIIEQEPFEAELLEEYLTNKKGTRVHLRLPKKGIKYNLLELAKKNAQLTFSAQTHQKKHHQTKIALEQLETALGIDVTRIEAYDISNTSGVQSVGGMVVFENGVPKKSDYRKFKIQTIQGINDYASMQEVVRRRIKNNTPLPNVMFIDGGKGQVNAVQHVLNEQSINIPVCGMVKDNKHRTNGLFYNGKLVDMQKEAFKLITTIQDEVHRFSIEYHKLLRKQTQFNSVLDDIVGIGKKRKQDLLRHFKSIDNIKNANLEELQQIPNLPKDVALNIFNYFRDEGV